MRRSLATASLLGLALVVLGTAVPARAGGWDSLRFRRDHYLVGTVAAARTEFFAGRLEGSGPLDGRTYYAYLLPDSRNELFGMIDPPTIPEGAIRLGALEVDGPLTGPDGYPYGSASLSFTVPDVPSGDYAIGFCDDPCTHGTVGWLAWGYLRIVHTPLEGQLLRARDGAEATIHTLRRELRQGEADATERLTELTAEVRAAHAAVRAASTARADAAIGSAPAPPEDGGSWAWPLPVGVSLGAGIATVVARVTRRRRAPGPPSPSTAERADLVERERAGV